MNIDQDYARCDALRAASSSQGGLGLPDRDYYLVADDAKFAAARAATSRYLTRLLAAFERERRCGGVRATP